MAILISILVFIVCILLILVILVQNSKGGGLASGFSSTGQVMGVRKTTDFLEKATWTLAISLLVLSLISAAVTPGSQEERRESEIQQFVDQEAVTPPAGFQPVDSPSPIDSE